MGRAIAQVALHRQGNLPEDDVVNTWHFENDSDAFGDTEELKSRLQTFYAALASKWAGTLIGTATVKIYDYDEAKPRVPVRTDNIGFGKLADSMPNEVCVCLSMSAAVVSGEAKASRRGRVFLGPFGRNVAVTSTGASDARPDLETRTLILDSAEALARGAAGTWRLAVFSPTTLLKTSSDDQAWNDVVDLWVDDAFDIQRRRGARPTMRDTRSLD